MENTSRVRSSPVAMASEAESTHVVPTILIVIGQLDVGGTERHLAQIVPPLRDAGLDVRIFTLKAGGEVGEQLAARGVPIVAHPRRRGGWQGVLQAAVLLVRVMRELQPHVLHLFLPAAYLVGAMSTLPLQVKRVMSRRSLATYQARHPGVGRLERLLHARMDAVLANSLAVARELACEGVSPHKLGLIYNGVVDRASGYARARARTQFDVAPETLVVVVIANLIPYKGHADLLDALALAADRLPPAWTMLFAGRDDGIGEALRAQAKQLGIDAHLRWLGAVDEVGPLLAAADIGVLASHEEGFSNSVLEGMAAGLPMVVTDVGGNAEAVVDGVCGRVVPARNPAALAAALLELAHAPAERLRMGEAARARAAKHFTLEACVARYETLYRNLVAGVAPPLPPPVLDE